MTFVGIVFLFCVEMCCLLFALLFCLCCSVTQWSVSPVESEFIVTFHGYFEKDERLGLVGQVLSSFSSGEWREIPRSNKAYELPSDFVLLRVVAKEKAVLAQLRSRPDVVRSVTPQLTVRGERSLMAKRSIRGTFVRRTNSSNAVRALKGAAGVSGESPASVPPNMPVAARLNAPWLWSKGVTGARVRVAVFDTGLGQRGAPFLNNVVEQRDWTSDKSLEDGVGHGTFVASMVAGTNPQCMGLAPDSELLFFRVFTRRRVSFTAWFLDAFNYAIHTKVDVLNLSIGGPDFMDKPFTEKVFEKDMVVFFVCVFHLAQKGS